MQRLHQPPTRRAALTLAGRLHAALTGDPEFRAHEGPVETGGVTEHGAVFHVKGADGRLYRVKVNRAS